MLNIVVGAGVLALPGLAIKQAGDHAFLAWLICAVAAFPLLTVFVILGRRYPDAGGISHYGEMAFGHRGYAAGAFLLLGAVLFGLPSIALTGGYYLALILDLHPVTAAIVLLGLATVIHLLPSELVSRANAYLAIIIIAAVGGLTLVGLILVPVPTEPGARIIPLSWDFSRALAPFMMIFFAFTGWEMAANTSEEFQNPRKDFPLAMYATFAIVITIYLSIAYLSQVANLRSGFETAFGQISGRIFGKYGVIGISFLAATIVLANLAGAIWAVSRLLYSLSKQGYLPPSVKNSLGGTPWVAVLVTSFSLFTVLLANTGDIFTLDIMLALAGQNFLILYGLAACSLFRLSRSLSERIISTISILIVISIILPQGYNSIYPILIIFLSIFFVNIGVIPSSNSRRSVP